MRVGNLDVIEFGKDVYREFKDDDVTGIAAELTYRFFLAIFPFIIFLTALGGFLANALDISNPAKEFVDLFGDRLPDDAASVIERQVNEVVNSRNGALLSFGIVGTVWAATGGASALIKGLNRVYDVPETRPFWHQKLLAFGLMLLATLAILIAISAFFATQVYGSDIADELGMAAAFEFLMRWATIPVMALILIAGMAFVYWAAPNAGLPFRWVSPGAVFFVVGWLLATVGLSFYVANFGSYNATYGALGGVVVLLLWFYVTNIILLLGAEINAVLDEQLIGPALEERRHKAAEAAAAKAREQPRTPEAAAAGARGPAMAPQPAAALAPATAGGSGAHRVQRAPEASLQQERAPARGVAGSLLALTGVALAALVMRRYARP